MSFFSGTSDKAKLAPRAKESKKGGKWMMDFMKSWGAPGTEVNYPRQGVAGLTPFEQELQAYLPQVLSDYNLAMGQYRDTLTGEYDPRTSDFWKGFRDEAGMLKQEGVSDIRKRANLGGMLQSSPAQAIESRYGQQMDSSMLKQLGELFERERDRKLTAAGQLPQQASALGATANLAQIPRIVEQARANAIYDEAMNELLAPYTLQANLAMGMMNYSPGTWIKPGGPSELGKINQAITNITDIATGLGF